MPMLSVITLRDLIIAHAAPDTLEMEHHAPVYILYLHMLPLLQMFTQENV